MALFTIARGRPRAVICGLLGLLAGALGGVMARPAAAQTTGVYAYVANHGANSVTIIDVASQTIVGGFSTGNNPTAAVVSTDGSTIYVAVSGDNAVQVFDAGTQTLKTTIVLNDPSLPDTLRSNGVGVYNLALSSDGSKLYAQVDFNNGGVSVIDTGTNSVISHYTVAGTEASDAFFFSTDNSRIYWNGSQGGGVTTTAFDPNTGNVLASVAIGDAVGPAVVSTALSTITTTNGVDSLIQVNTAGMTATTVKVPVDTTTKAADGSLLGGLLSIDGRTAYFVGAPQLSGGAVSGCNTGWIQIVIADVSSGQILKCIGGAANTTLAGGIPTVSTIQVTPDNRYYLFVVPNPYAIAGTVYVIAASSNTLVNTVSVSDSAMNSAPMFGGYQGITPQTGWWWTPAAGGRGWSIEVRNGDLFAGGFAADASGNPYWVIAQGPMTTPGLFNGTLQYCADGPTLSGGTTAGTQCSSVGAVTFQFSTSTTGQVTTPDGQTQQIVRFTSF